MQTRAQYQKDVEFATRPIRDRYLSRLDMLKRSLGGRGDARCAAAVQDEIDRVWGASADASGLGSVVGVWKIVYTTGATQRYTIGADGSVTHDEDSGKVIPPRAGKMTAKGTDIVIDFADGAIERLKPSRKKLVTELFTAKSQYPDGKPAFHGTGTMIPIGK